MENKKNNLKRNIIIIIIIAAAALVCAGGFYYYQKYEYYRTHFYTGTVINGVDCSDMTVEEAEATLQQSLDGYSLNVTDREGRTYTLNAEDIQMSYKSDGSAERLMLEQNPILWIFNMSEPANENFNIGFSYNSESVRAWLESLECVTNGTAPVDAHEAMGDDGFWYIVPEEQGSQIDVDVAFAYIEAAINNKTSDISLEDSGCYLVPTVTSEDETLKLSVDEKNKEIRYQKTVDEITNVSVSLSVAFDDNDDDDDDDTDDGAEDVNTVTSVLDQKTLKTMVVKDANGDPEISKDMIYQWVEDWADENALLSSSFLFVTHEGSVMSLPDGSDYGWELDLDKTVEAVYASIESKTSGSVTPVLTSIDDGSLLSESTYIEISIPDQRMILYVNGRAVVDTDVVTGCVNKKTETPSNGIWHVYSKSKNYTLKGYYEDGTLEYATPVSYWIPFNKIGVGIHDMVSRKEFGGDIYLTDGSHGCINTPFDNAEKIYNTISVGTKVIVWG